MKRVKTKQEFGEHFRMEWAREYYGLPYKDEDMTPGYYITEEALTTDPHPFDSMDIKVRVTPKQSKKLQEKAFKMGYSWSGGQSLITTDNIIFDMRGKKMHLYAYNLESRWVDEGANHTELTYKQFMNGTVPKKKKFKAGDWVEAYHYSSGELYIGEIEDIDECYGIRDVSGRYHACKKSTAKHTTKPKEQPLKYKEWDVKIGCGQVIQIGCKSFDRSELQTALRVMNTVNEHSDVNAFRTWLDSNQEKLGL